MGRHSAIWLSVIGVMSIWRDTILFITLLSSMTWSGRCTLLGECGTLLPSICDNSRSPRKGGFVRRASSCCYALPPPPPFLAVSETTQNHASDSWKQYGMWLSRYCCDKNGCKHELQTNVSPLSFVLWLTTYFLSKDNGVWRDCQRLPVARDSRSVFSFAFWAAIFHRETLASYAKKTFMDMEVLSFLKRGICFVCTGKVNPSTLRSCSWFLYFDKRYGSWVAGYNVDNTLQRTHFLSSFLTLIKQRFFAKNSGVRTKVEPWAGGIGGRIRRTD